MLTLESPFYSFAGIPIFRDHAVPNQFYYAAPNPVIAHQAGRLVFDLMTYTVDLKHSVLAGTTIPDELGAGFLTMATECPLSTTQRSTILAGLQDATGLPQEQLILVPIPYHKGTVTVLALDQYKAPDGATPNPASDAPLQNRPTFVEAILGSGTPALLGDLRTIFSLSLSQNGAAFLQGLFAEQAAPVGVIYELSYYGLRPAVEARVHADIARIYTHFGGNLGVQYQYFKVEVDAALDYLREQRAVEIELTSQMVGEAAEKAKERAMSLFKEDIIQNLFRPIPPNQPNQLSNLASTLGNQASSAVGSTAPVKLTLQFKRQEELKQATYEYNERAPEERSHAPQGFLPILLSPTQLQEHTHHVSLGSPFFELLEVLISGPPKEEFEALGIRQLEAVVTYGTPGSTPLPETQSVLFRADTTGDKTVAFQRNGRKSLAYSCALNYDFLRGAADGDSFRYELPAVARTGRSLAINPSADFGVLEVEVELGRVHPDVRQVDVDLAYTTPDGAFNAQEHFRLVPGSTPEPPPRWLVRTRTTVVNKYSAVYTFTLNDGLDAQGITGQTGGTWVAPAVTSGERLLRVDAPFVGERELTIKPVIPTGATIEQLTVEVEYDDPQADYHRRKLVQIDPPFATTRLTWPLLDRNKQAVRYRVTVQEQGMVSEGDWETTSDPSITVGAEGHKVGRIKVQLLGPPLNGIGLDGLQARFLVVVSGAPAGNEDEAVDLLFDGTQTTLTVDLTLPPGAPLKYRYQTISFRQDGTRRESEWKEASTTLLVLQVVNL